MNAYFFRQIIGVLFCLYLSNVGQSLAGDQSKSGYHYASDAIRQLQDDVFANPGTLWIEEGARLWQTVDGAAKKSCAQCHGAKGARIVDAVTRYPRFDSTLKRPITLSQRILECRRKHMRAKPLKPESEPLLSLEIYMRKLAAGRPLQVKVDGPMQSFFQRGKSLWFQRRGQFNLACNQCHDQRPGEFVRGEHLSEGQINNFPSYLVRWGAVGSTHRRFQLCDTQARAKPYAIGSPEYTALEIYVANRGRGLKLEAPAVRP